MITRRCLGPLGGLASQATITRPAFSAFHTQARFARHSPLDIEKGDIPPRNAKPFNGPGFRNDHMPVKGDANAKPKGHIDPHVDSNIWTVTSRNKYVFPHADEFGENKRLREAAGLATSGNPERVPDPLPIVPDVESFLRIIGRGLHRYADKFESWEHFWAASSETLASAVPATRERRYIRSWMERYRNGNYGPGWNLKYIEDGRAILAVYRIPGRKGPGSRVVVNVPAGKTGHTITEEEIHVMGYPYRIKGNKTPCGPHARSFKGNKACIDDFEGMWEFKRGEKVDGGERRKSEVRFLRRVAERRAMREAEAGALV